MIEGGSDLPSTALASRSGSGADESGGFRRSIVDLASSPFENESALRENHFALKVLENLDHNWFFDNITGFSLCSPSSNGYLLASAADDSVRNIEMVNRTEAIVDEDTKRRNAIGLPRPSLQRTLSELQESERRLELEKRERERKREANPPKKGHQRLQSDITGRRGSRSVGVIHYRLPSYDLTEKRVRFLDSAINPAQEITGTTLSSMKVKQQYSGIPRPPKLESIPSGKQLQEPACLDDLGAQQSRVRRRDRRRTTKSMTDLEIDELQGFMDRSNIPCHQVKQQSSGIPRPPKLESIPSGKQLQEPACLADLGAQQSRVRRRDRRRTTKSMTDLEIDELQGFMDLGFKFNMNNLSPQVVNMLPGLQRLGGQRVQTSIVSRPYLSEAWLTPRSDSPVLNWRVPSEHGEAVTMKEQLKFWARAVASTMPQES